MTGGRFITFEGGEGAGKSTQSTRLCEVLHERGLDVVGTREPGGSPGAEAIRELLVQGEPGRWDALSETLLHFAARRDHYIRTIAPALARGDWVVCDRFADSTTAYQAYGLGVEKAFVSGLYDQVLGEFAPDLTIILDLPVDQGLARSAARGGADRYERMDKDFHQRLRDGFLAIAQAEPERCTVIDAGRDEDWVHDAVLALVDVRLADHG
ncbi:MAG: dTMP kinase [Proteobacteria bacterium]|nr:dTMP kinase [Pseudomonadota bacterium]